MTVQQQSAGFFLTSDTEPALPHPLPRDPDREPWCGPPALLPVCADSGLHVLACAAPDPRQPDQVAAPPRKDLSRSAIPAAATGAAECGQPTPVAWLDAPVQAVGVPPDQPRLHRIAAAIHRASPTADAASQRCNQAVAQPQAAWASLPSSTSPALLRT